MMDLALTEKAIVINKKEIISPSAPAIIIEAIGGDYILDESIPCAPYGCKTPKRFLYPKLGLSFLVNHNTDLVSELTCYYDVADEKLPFVVPVNAYSGKLTIYDTEIETLHDEDSLSFSKQVSVEHLVGGFFRVVQGITSAYFFTRGKVSSSKRRSKKKHITTISLCFNN